jgi:alkylation response protein AidB-like acyl-CoA dehydrogenase
MTPPILDALKREARAEGLWNLFLPDLEGAGLSNLEYAPLAEEMGRVFWASEVFNCNAPDTGNMEVLHRYGDVVQKEKMAQASARGRNSFVFCHDRTGSRFIGRHKHRDQHPM